MSYKSWNETTRNVSKLLKDIKSYKCINQDCDSKSFIDGKCSKCHTDNKEIFQKITKLEELLFNLKKDYFKSGVTKTYSFLDELYTIKHMNIAFVKEFLQDINYDEIRKNTLLDLKEKFKKGILKSSESNSLQSILLTKDRLTKEDMDIMTQMMFHGSMQIKLAKKYTIEFTKEKAKELNIMISNTMILLTNMGLMPLLKIWILFLIMSL